MLLLGLLGAGACFHALSGAALPYPDPTPELLEQQNDVVVQWALGMLGCLFVASMGLVVLFASWRQARQPVGRRG